MSTEELGFGIVDAAGSHDLVHGEAALPWRTSRCADVIAKMEATENKNGGYNPDAVIPRLMRRLRRLFGN